MKHYLDSDSIKLWEVILNGEEPPKTKIDDVFSKEVNRIKLKKKRITKIREQ